MLKKKGENEIIMLLKRLMIFMRH